MERRGDEVWDIEFPGFLLAGVEAAEVYTHLPKDMVPRCPRRDPASLRSQQPGSHRALDEKLSR